MKITILGFLLGLLLLAIPIYTIYYFRLRVMRRLLVTFGSLIVVIAVVAIALYGGLRLDSIVYDIVMFLLFSLLSSVFSLKRSRLKLSKILIPVVAGSVVAVAFVGFYFVFLVCGERNPFIPHIFVPLFGMIAGGMTGCNTKALQTYYDGLRHHGQLYNYIIGNGGTHREAIRYFVRRGLQAAIVNVAKQMSRIFFTTAPVILFSMVMAGVDVLTATALQVLFYVATLSASIISLLIALLIGRKYSFDEYERLKPVYRETKVNVEEASASDSSSSLSELHDTGSGSLLQGE